MSWIVVFSVLSISVLFPIIDRSDVSLVSRCPPQLYEQLLLASSPFNYRRRALNPRHPARLIFPDDESELGPVGEQSSRFGLVRVALSGGCDRLPDPDLLGRQRQAPADGLARYAEQHCPHQAFPTPCQRQSGNNAHFDYEGALGQCRIQSGGRLKLAYIAVRTQSIFFNPRTAGSRNQLRRLTALKTRHHQRWGWTKKKKKKKPSPAGITVGR